jgi:hypothetical protein
MGYKIGNIFYLTFIPECSSDTHCHTFLLFFAIWNVWSWTWSFNFLIFDCISHHFRSKLNFNIFFHNGRRWSFRISEINFRLHFSPFQIQLKLSFLIFKRATGGHFGCPKLIFDCISRHFRSKLNFDYLFQNGRRRPFWISEINFHLHFSPFQIQLKLFFLSKWSPHLKPNNCWWYEGFIYLKGIFYI